MTSADVKIPPDWLRTPAHETRSQLLDARRVDRREWVLVRTAGESSDRNFARSETLFRDWFRRTGVFDSPRTPPPTALTAVTGSASVTRSAVLEKRQAARRVASLAFEPQEIERLADRPRAHELREWWKQRDGYVEDPLARFVDSTRLELMRRRGRVVGNSGDSEDGSNQSTGGGDSTMKSVRLQRAHRKQQEVAPKVTRVRHPVPDAYLGVDRADVAIIQRADDLYAQERRSESPISRTTGGAGGLGGFADESKWSLPISPIKDAKPIKRSRALREGLFAEGLAQRSMLDQLKAAAASLPSVSSPSPPMLSPLTRHHHHHHTIGVDAGDGDDQRQPPVRCGGFL